MIIAVTGGRGFIGSRLVKWHLDQGDIVRLLTRHQSANVTCPDLLHIYHGDLTNKTDLLHTFVDGVDVLYHCAAEIQDEARMHEVHINGTKNLLEAAKQVIGHLVQLSSVAVYGLRTDEIVTEKIYINPMRIMSIYEITKAASEKMVVEMAPKYGFSFSVLRPTIVFGPMMPNRSLFKMISLIDKGLFFFIGKPGASANYIHVDNVIKGLILCGKNLTAKGQIYNLSDYRTLEQFVAIIAEALGRSVPKLRLPEKPIQMAARLLGKIPGVPLTESRVKAMTNRTVYATTRIEKELGYTHSVSMEEGLWELVNVWKQRK